MSAKNTVVYIKGDRDVEVAKADVTLGDILSVECSDKMVLSKVKAAKIIKLDPSQKQRRVVSVMKIIACIHELYPEAEIQNLGETDIIVTFENQKTASVPVHIIKTALVSVLTFTGAAFSIMAFNNDVDVTTLFSQIYEVVTGEKADGFSVLEISYSIGITVGILVFFNHFGKRKFTVDPTPMEVQMRLYENDIQTTLVENAARKGKETDIDGKDSSGNHRT